ncbi:MAG: hypothetical protein ABIP97_01170 [Chthoniobacterales bacterium]
MKKVFSILLLLLFVGSTSVMAAPLSTKTKDSIKAQIAKAGTDTQALSALIATLIQNAPAPQRAEIAAFFVQSLPPSVGADKTAMASITSSAVNAAKQAAAASGAGNAGQTASATLVANAILKSVNPIVFADVRTAATNAGANTSGLIAVAQQGSGGVDEGTLDGSGDPGVNTAGQLAPSGVGSASSGAGAPGNTGSTTSP